ncbi:MAG: S41 family peptidase [Oscillospiraceae bacterium]
MNKKISIGITTSLVLVAVTITFTATMIFAMKMFDSKVSSAQERAQMYDKLSEIDKIMRQNYYGAIDDKRISDSLSQGILMGLDDPDSSYLTSEEIAARASEMQGTSVSTGLSLEKNTNGYAVVNNVVSESAADKMDIKVGDIITKVDDKDVLAVGYDEAVSMLLNRNEGDKIAVAYNRAGEENTVEIIPNAVETTSVIHSQIDDIYYIRIDRITKLTQNQFKSAIDSALGAENVRGIVFDVRDLFGGYDISIIAGMLDRLMPTGTLVKGTYKDSQSKVLYTSDDESVKLPMAVIVNEYTYGFAELFAAVMSEADNCAIVGKTTAGHGTLQQLVKLTDGSGVDITVATLSTSSGLSFNIDGLKPDYDVSVPDSFIRVVQPNEQNDPQYKKAAEIIRASKPNNA